MDRPGLLVVFTEGDAIRGLGHVSRCSAYAEGWRQRGGEVRWVVDGDATATRMIREGQPVQILRWQDDPAALTLVGSAAVTLADSYSATPEVLAAIAGMTATPIFIDDLRRDYPRGLVVHAAPDPAPETLAASTAAVWLEGPGWQPLRQPFWDLPPRPPAQATVKRILLVFGGGDLRSLGASMARLAGEAYPDARIDLVVGARQPIPDASPHLRVHEAIDAAAMAALMLEADVALSGAGQTVFELARCGVPTVMVGVVDNQRANLDHWPDLCGFIDAGTWDASDLDERVRAGLLSLEPVAIRQAITERALALVDGQGVRRLFDRLDQTAAGRLA